MISPTAVRYIGAAVCGVLGGYGAEALYEEFTRAKRPPEPESQSDPRDATDDEPSPHGAV